MFLLLLFVLLINMCSEHGNEHTVISICLILPLKVMVGTCFYRLLLPFFFPRVYKKYWFVTWRWHIYRVIVTTKLCAKTSAVICFISEKLTLNNYFYSHTFPVYSWVTVKNILYNIIFSFRCPWRSSSILLSYFCFYQTSDSQPFEVIFQIFIIISCLGMHLCNWNCL